MGYAFLRFPGFLDRALTLSYDDGVAADKRLIGIMSSHGLKGTFNLNSMKFASCGEEEVKRVRELYLGSGNEVAAHGYNHLPLAEVPSCAGVDDVINDRRTFEGLFGGIMQGMAYANGSYDGNVVNMLRMCGICYCRTTVSTHSFELPGEWLTLHPTCHHDDPELMKLAESFVTMPDSPYYLANRAKLFYLWGHAYEFDNNNNWSVIEGFADYIGGRDNIWYATNIEIYRYVMAYNGLVFSACADTVYNPSSTDVYMRWFNRDVMIPAGATVALQRG